MSQTSAEDPLPSSQSLTQSLKNLFSKLRRNGNGHHIQAFVEEHMDDDEASEDLTIHEKRLIKASLSFDKVTADEVAVARSDVKFVDIDDTFEDIWKTFLEHRHSRLPVVGEDLDEVLGFITLKDIVCFVDKPKEFDIKSAMRKCTFVPDTLALPEVLQILRRDKVAMAVVIDEYGGTAGLITLKDILEKLVGDIDDEDDPEEAPQIQPRGNGIYALDPRLELEELERKLNIHLILEEDTDVETIGGLLMHLAGRVPSEGESFEVQKGLTLKVESADARRLKTLLLLVQPSSPEAEQADLPL